MMLIFDLVLLLSKGKIHLILNQLWFVLLNLTARVIGKVVYFGDSSDIVAYFDELGHICPPQVNPADYFCTGDPHFFGSMK